MNPAPGDKFDEILAEVVDKSVSFLRFHVPRFSQLWTDFWRHFEPNPRLVHPFAFDRERFGQDAAYRLETLRAFERAIVEGYHAERAIFATVYGKVLPSPDLSQYFSPAEIPLLGFKISDTLVTSLGQFISMDPSTIPLEYVVVARNKSMIRLRGTTDEQAARDLSSSGVPCTVADVRAAMSKLAAAGLLDVKRDGNTERYENLGDFILPDADEQFFKREIQPVLDWAVQFWRSFYNLRELNTPIDPRRPHSGFLEKTVSRSATQGFSSAHFVVANLVKYFEMI
ncbi:MAG: hypothetical protein ACTSU5_20875 [Promethearchaeota archaeon]